MIMAKFEEIWREQCAATVTIRSQYGERAALDYLIGEKLLHFTSAARTRPEFAAQLPAFVAEVRAMFSRESLMAYLTRLEADLTEKSHEVDMEDTYLGSAAISDLTSLKQIEDLLRADRLGTA
jgi:hypothetical protein